MTQQEIDETIAKMNESFFGHNDGSWEQNENKIEEVLQNIQIKYKIYNVKINELLSKREEFIKKPRQDDGAFTAEQIVGIYNTSNQMVQASLDFLNETNNDVEYVDNYFSNQNDDFYKSETNKPNL